MKYNTVEERFWAKVEKGDGCWEWHSCLDTDGYGLFWLDRTFKRAHRISYILKVGTIPLGLLVCHHCDNPRCVRPDHLFLGTEKDNALDAVKKQRNSAGERSGSARLTYDDVRTLRNSYDPSKRNGTELAHIYNITKANVSSIIHNKTWKVDPIMDGAKI